MVLYKKNKNVDGDKFGEIVSKHIKDGEKMDNGNYVTQRSGAKYYEGEIVDKHKTELGHLFISLNNCKVVQFKEGTTVLYATDPKKMNFLVPKRRERVYEYLEMVKFNDKVRVMLLPETNSGKYCVAEAERV